LLVSEIARTLAQQSSQAVIDWAESVDGNDLRFKATVFSKTCGALAQYHRPQAVAWVLSHYGEPHAEGGAKLVALNWAESNPDAAFEWLGSLPSGQEKTEAVGFVFAYWLKTEPGKAAAWQSPARRSIRPCVWLLRPSRARTPWLHSNGLGVFMTQEPGSEHW
jgi:hypothetical protein